MEWYFIMTIIISVCAWIGMAAASVSLRKQKGYSDGWLLGLLFGAFALIYSAGLPDLIAREKLKSTYEVINQRKPILKHIAQSDKEDEYAPTNRQSAAKALHMWRCSNCGEMISEEICPFCGADNK